MKTDKQKKRNQWSLKAHSELKHIYMYIIYGFHMSLINLTFSSRSEVCRFESHQGQDCLKYFTGNTV